jgi:hypothetical protein
MFYYDTKEKEHQNTLQSDKYSGAMTPRTYQIALCFDALSITLFPLDKVGPNIFHNVCVFLFRVFIKNKKLLFVDRYKLLRC